MLNSFPNGLCIPFMKHIIIYILFIGKPFVYISSLLFFINFQVLTIVSFNNGFFPYLLWFFPGEMCQNTEITVLEYIEIFKSIFTR